MLKRKDITCGHWKKGFDLLRRHFRQFLLTVVQPLPEDVTHLDETDQAGLHPGKVSGSVGERGQGLLHSLSFQVTILANGQLHRVCQYQHGRSRLGLEVSLDTAVQVNGGITGVVAGSEALQGQL